MDDPSLFHEFDPVGRCIYCGSETDLKTEHIVPEGLGGRFELPQASCLQCGGITSNIEGAVLRGLFYAPRARLGMLSKKRKKQHPSDWPIEIDYGTHKEPRRVPIAKHPTTLIGLVLPVPTILAGVFTLEDKMISIVTLPMGGELDHLPPGAKFTVSAQYNGLMYARMLAKIGHGYAVAKIGLGNFKPALQDLIRHGQEKFPIDLIGGSFGPEPPGETLHEISLINDWNGFAVVRLRLFSIFGMPIYYIVVGTR